MARHLVQRIVVSHLLRAQSQLTRLVPPLYPERCLFHDNFIWQKRLMHKDLELSDHTCEISSYQEYRSNFKPIVQIVVQTIREILDLPVAEINKILVTNPQLKKRSRANILNNFYNLLDVGVKKDTIAQNIWLLAHENDKLKNKLECIVVLNMDNNALVPWLRLTQDELTNYVFYTQNDMDSYTHNKIEHFANRLECSTYELCELMVRYPFLVKISIAKIDNKLDILHEYNVNNKNILRDMWVFQYSEKHIRYRCDLYKDTNIEMKTWAIRCPLKIISAAIRRNQIRRCYLGYHNTITDYLLRKLNIDNNYLQLMLNKWPGIIRVDIVKLDKMINILLNNGLSGGDIVEHGRIFYFNTNTIEKRIEFLKKNGLQIKLTTLMLGEIQFKQYVKRYELEEKKSLLLKSYNNIEGYLMHKFNSDEATIEKIKKRWPRLTRTSIIKLEKLFNILKRDFTDKDLIYHGGIFSFKPETLENRIETLKEAGITPKITALMLTTKYFNEYVKLHSRTK